MPTVLVPVFIALGATATAAVVLANIVVLVGTMALSSYQKRKEERKARAAFDAAQVDRLANVPATVASRELAMGRVRKGGTVFFRTSIGQFKQKFVMCIAIASHEIDAVEQIYFNDQPVDIDAEGQVHTAPWGRYVRVTERVNVTGATNVLPFTPVPGSWGGQRIKGTSGGSGDNIMAEQVFPTVVGNVLTIPDYVAPPPPPDPYLPPSTDPESWRYEIIYQHDVFVTTARVRWKLGAPGQAADARLMELLPGVWTADHKATGVAYLICEFDYDETSFPSGLPNVTALIRGAKIYDPRNGGTAWTETPALMMRHALLHPQFGKRTSLSAAEDARIIAAANAGDAGISYTGSDWVALYRAAIVVPFGAPCRDILDDMSQAMAGQWAYAAGEVFVRAGVYQAPVLALSDADLAVVQRSDGGGSTQNPITISTHRARNDKINTVLPRIWDQASNYVETPITPFRPIALVIADGAELAQEVTMPAVFYAGQAYQIAGVMMRDSRDPLTVTLPFKLSAYPVQLFDTVTLTLARYGWSAKEFHVLGRTFLPDGYVQLVLKETSAAIFQFGAPYVPQGTASNTGLPRPWDISPPQIVAISSGEGELIVQSDGTVVNAVRVTWNAVSDASVKSGSIDVEYQVLATGTVYSVSVPGDATEALLTGLQDLAVIAIRLRSRSAIAVSSWSLQVLHQVVGKTEPPPDIENLSISGAILSWRLPRRVPDLAGFVFRFHYGNNLDWNSASPLHTGVLTESPYELITRPGGVVTIMGKAIDTTGNVSLASANIVMNLGDPPIANIIETVDFGALGWPYMPGEQSGWTLVGGNPSADALDSFYGTDDQSFYGEATDSFYEPGTYGQMVYVTDEISIVSALAGSIMTLDSVTQGVDLRIEFRLSGPGSFYGADNAAFYDDDGAPMYGAAGPWQPWPGQLIAANDAYQFRVTIGAGPVRGVLEQLVLTIDAPDLEERIDDLAISSGGTAIPYGFNFASIKNVQATLQANGSGAVTVEIDKTIPMTPVIRAFNSAHVAVSGAKADITIKGY